MKLRKTVAFLIALSMLAGLVCLVPASALTPVTGYGKEVIVDEHFSGNYDKHYVSVYNGTIADGVLNFTLSGESYMAVNADIDTVNNRQYVIDFHLSTTAAYTDPFTATFIGIRGAQTDIAPYSDVNGAWVGLTEDKLILWYSYKNNFWDKPSAKEGVHYALIDAPFSLGEADYRIIYDGTTAEFCYMEGDEATTLLTLTYNTSKKSVTMTDGSVSLTSPITFSEGQDAHYFTLYNYKRSETLEEDPLAPRDDWDEEEGGEEEPAQAASVTLDDFVFTVYGNLLMTDAQKKQLQELKEQYQAILDAYGTEDAVYQDNSVDTRVLESTIQSIDITLEEDALWSTDAATIISEYAALESEFVTKETAEAYPSRFDDFSQMVAEAKEQVENGEADYSLAALEKIEKDIASAKELVNRDKLRASQLESAYMGVARAISNLGISTQDGIPVYTQSFTSGLSYSKFSGEWTEQGDGNELVPVTTQNGIPVNLWGTINLPDQGINTGTNYRYQMILRNAYDVYAVKATLTKSTAGGYASMALRVGTGTNIHEEDRQSPGMITGYQKASITIGTPSNGTNFNTLMIALEDGNFVMNSTASKRVGTTINMTSLGVLSNNNKTFTILVKDFGELIEILALKENGDKVKLATIFFNSATSGTLINEVTGETKSFAGMNLSKASAGHVGFGSRNAVLYIKDFSISTNISPSSEYLVNPGDSDPSDFSFGLDSNHLAVGERAGFAALAAFENLKVVGKDQYKEGTIDVSEKTTFTTTLGESVVAVDAETAAVTGVRRGSDILTATYQGIDTTYTDKVLVTVEDEAYKAPQKTDVYEGRITSAVIENSQVFKSLDEGLSAIPIIRFTYPNGTSGILPSDCYVEYFSSNDNVIAYDDATGRYETKAPGTAKIYAVVYDSVGTTTTPTVNVEVTEEGMMNLGASYTVAAQDLLELAKSKDVTVEAMWDVVAAALEAGMDVPAKDDTDVALLISVLGELSGDAAIGDIVDACALVREVRKIYDIVQRKNGSGDDLAGYLFDRTLNCEKFGIHKDDYNTLSKTKQSQLTTRMFTQLAKLKTGLTITSIRNTFDTIFSSVANADTGGGGKGTVTSKTNSGLGNTSFIAGMATPVAMPAKQLPTAEEAAAAASRFTDIDDAPWARDIIGSLAAQGIIDGYEDATIRPNDIITREEFTKLLVEALGMDTTAAGPAAYSDVPSGAWQEKFVAAATKAGLVQGVDTLRFGVGLTISRQDMALMIYRAIVKNNIVLPSEKTVAFRDAHFVAGYAQEAVNRLAAAGVISGVGDDTFAPEAGATRAQAFAMIYALANLAN